MFRRRQILVEPEGFPKKARALRETSRQLVELKRHGHLATVRMTIAGSENSWGRTLQRIF